MEPERIAAHRGTVRGILLRLVRNSALADDLTQEALLRATRAAPSMRGEASPSTWLTAIALNVVRDHFRANKRQPQTDPLDQAEHLADGLDTEGQVMQAEMSRCILDHVARLPQRQQEAVLLYHFAGLDHRMIAHSLDISEGNARVILHRGLSSLRVSLQQECSLNFQDSIPCERL